jgi:hypothetical protein
MDTEGFYVSIEYDIENADDMEALSVILDDPYIDDYTKKDYDDHVELIFRGII